MSCGSNTFNSIQSLDCACEAAPAQPSWFARVTAAIGAALDRACRREVAIAFEKARQRRILLQLDEHILRDIGLTREEAVREARKPFWK